METLIDIFSAYSNSVLEFLLVNSIYSLVLACIVLLVKIIYPKLPQPVEYGFWCIVLFRLILPNDLSFDYAISGTLVPWINKVSELPIISAWFVSGEVVDNSQALFGSTNASLSVLDYLFIAWFSVVSFVLVRYTSLRIQLVKLLNQSRPIVDYWPVRCANRWRLNFWIKRRVIIIAADKYLSPFTFSFMTPIIFIPRKILETNNEALIESIIAHEMAHIKRHDCFWLLIQNCIQILYFFNPVVWLIVRRLSSLRENMCDEMVLSVNKVKPADYGKSLLSVLRFNISGEVQGLLSAAFLGQKSQIKKRVEAIGNFTRTKKRPIVQYCFIIAFGFFLLPFQKAGEQTIIAEKSRVLINNVDNSPFPEHVKDQVELNMDKYHNN